MIAFGFGIPGALAAGLLAAPERVAPLAVGLSDAVVHQFGIVYQGVFLTVLAAVVVLAIGPWGRLKLGGPEAEPEFSGLTHFSLLFAAGIAAGIVYNAPSDALQHYQHVPPGADAAPRTSAAAVAGLRYALFHHGVSVWSGYVLVGITIAYVAYNRGGPLRVSAVVRPLVGSNRALEVAIDALAVVATIVGVTTTVGFTIREFLAGIEFYWGVETSEIGIVLFAIAVGIVFTTSAVTGLHRGIRRFALLGVAGLIALGGALAVVGPTGTLVSLGMASTSAYAREFVAMSTATSGEWVANWTLFYLNWWLAWTPFVGLFIARISWGRTIRGVVLSATGAVGATTAWFVVIGGTTLGLDGHGEPTALAAANEYGTAAGVFSVFEAVPAGEVLFVLFLGLIIVLLVTSADSSTLSLGRLLNTASREPPAAVLVGCGLAQTAIAVAFVAAGGERAVRAGAVLVGSPIAGLVVAAVVGLFAAFVRADRLKGS